MARQCVHQFYQHFEDLAEKEPVHCSPKLRLAGRFGEAREYTPSPSVVHLATQSEAKTFQGAMTSCKYSNNV